MILKPKNQKNKFGSFYSNNKSHFKICFYQMYMLFFIIDSHCCGSTRWKQFSRSLWYCSGLPTGSKHSNDYAEASKTTKYPRLYRPQIRYENYFKMPEKYMLMNYLRVNASH